MPPTNNLVSAKPKVVIDTAWYMDTTASYHLITNQACWENSQPYMGSNHVMLGNGQFVPILNTDSTTLHTGKYALSLNHLLHRPS